MTPELVEIGHMQEKRWHSIADSFAELDMMPRDYSLAGFLLRDPADDLRIQARRLTLALLDSDPFSILIVRQRDGTIRYLNRRCADYFGIRCDDFLGRPVIDFSVHPADRERLLDDISRHGLAQDRELELRTPRGEVLSAALRVAERIRRTEEQARFALPEGPEIHYTVSIGAAVLEGARDGKTLLRRADQALYEEKHAGRKLVRPLSVSLA